MKILISNSIIISSIWIFSVSPDSHLPKVDYLKYDFIRNKIKNLAKLRKETRGLKDKATLNSTFSPNITEILILIKISINNNSIQIDMRKLNNGTRNSKWNTNYIFSKSDKFILLKNAPEDKNSVKILFRVKQNFENQNITESEDLNLDDRKEALKTLEKIWTNTELLEFIKNNIGKIY